MPVHASILKTLALALALLPGLPAAASGIEGVAPPISSPAADSLRNPATGSRSAYETALQQRQAGDPASALRTIESALSALQAAMADPGTTARTDLADLEARLSALYDATGRICRTSGSSPVTKPTRAFSMLRPSMRSAPSSPRTTSW